MFKLFSKNKDRDNKNLSFKSPIDGKVINIEDVPDQVFSQKMVGDGFAVEPKNGNVYAPFDGEILQIFPTNHAICLKSNEGIEMIIHIGIDTVEIKGDGFTRLSEVGAKVSAGDLIHKFDLATLISHGKDTVTPIVITNFDAIAEMNVNYGERVHQDTVCNLKLK